MRRHSLVGPLLLILIGALFLLRNIRPEWATFELIARYWPFLLIAWGVLRLVEILYWRISSKPLPARGLRIRAGGIEFDGHPRQNRRF